MFSTSRRATFSFIPRLPWLFSDIVMISLRLEINHDYILAIVWANLAYFVSIIAAARAFVPNFAAVFHSSVFSQGPGLLRFR